MIEQTSIARHRGKATGSEILSLAVVAFTTAAIFRLHVLPLSVIDWDESLYLLVSRDILNGKFPYQGTFEHKPVALYYLFALAQILFGQSVVAIRVLAIIACGGTALIIALFLRRATSADMLAAAAAAALYGIFSTLNRGMATNTEILLNFYAVLALYLTNGGRMLEAVTPHRALAAGAVLSLMLNTNYLAALPIMGLGVAYAYACARRTGLSRAAPHFTMNGLFMAGGFVATSVALLLPIAIWSDMGDYFERQIQFLSVYRTHKPLLEQLASILSITSIYGILITLSITKVFFILFSREHQNAAPGDDNLAAFQALIYLAFTALACVISGWLFPHYFILLLPSMCILVGLFLASIPSARALRSFCTVWLILMSIACLALEQHNVRTRWASLVAWLSGHPADLPIAIAHDLRGSLQPDSFVYVYDYQPILYFLLNARMPIKYAFPPHHLYPDYGRDPLSEMTEILAKTPQIIIAGSDPATGQFGAASYLLNATLKQKYEILKSYPVRGTGAVFVYRRLTAAHAQHPDELK